MSELFFAPEWRSLLTAVALATDADDAPRLGAAELLLAWGDPLRAEYIRACCAPPSGTGDADTVTATGGTLLPDESRFAPLWGWVPSGRLLCFWHRGFITRVHGPLDAVREALPDLILREPLYQTPTGPAVATVSDRQPLYAADDGDHWTWGCESEYGDATMVDGGGPMLPKPLFDLLPWPPLFVSSEAAAVALSAALLAEAHELAHVA